MQNYWLDVIQRKRPYDFLPSLEECDHILEKCIPYWERIYNASDPEKFAEKQYRHLHHWNVGTPTDDYTYNRIVKFYDEQKRPHETSYMLYEALTSKVHGIMDIIHRKLLYRPYMWLIGPPELRRYLPPYQAEPRETPTPGLIWHGPLNHAHPVFTYEGWYDDHILIGHGDEVMQWPTHYGAVKIISQ